MRRSAMRMLLLEDDEVVARGVVRLVAVLGHQAKHVWTVTEAQAALTAERFDLILADFGLANGENGLDLLLWAQQHMPSVRRILTSGAANAANYASHPALETFLPKPFGIAEITKLLRPRSIEVA